MKSRGEINWLKDKIKYTQKVLNIINYIKNTTNLNAVLSKNMGFERYAFYVSIIVHSVQCTYT